MKQTSLAILVALALVGCTTPNTTNPNPSGTGSKTGSNTGTNTGTSTGTNVGANVNGPTTPVGAGVTHTDNITASETWKKGLHIVDGDVRVSGSNAPVLTIEPGCVIKFTPGSRLTISDNGGLIAQGGSQSADMILFTTQNASPNKGDWDGIYIQNSNSSQTKLSNCIVEYAGAHSEWSEQGAAIYVGGDNEKASFDHVTVRHSNGYGFQFYGSNSGASTFTNNSATDCKIPLTIAAATLGTLGTPNTFTGNSFDVVEVQSDTVKSNATWHDQGVPFRVQGVVNVQDANSPVLTLEAGSTFQMGQSAELVVGDGSPGALMAVGTAAKPITFTSLPNAKNPGEWAGLAFWGQTNISQTKLDHCAIDYAGGDPSSGREHAALYAEVAIPVTNTSITNSASFGVATSTGITLTLGADVTYSNNASGNVQPQ